MIILGIETSCDETSASVVKDGKIILSHVVATSQEMHAKTGGIIPENAAREQVKSIIPVIETAISDSLQTRSAPEARQAADYSKNKAVDSPLRKSDSEASRLWAVDHIDAIAVTIGPGLIGSLLVGVETAKTLSYVWKKPIVPVNHLVAHIYANFICEFLKSNFQFSKKGEPKLPAIALVVSGGHTDLVLLKDHGNIKWIGGTRDDAAGEAFDKTARLLGLPYPGGPSIAQAASLFKGEKQIMRAPRPMLDKDNFDFSFSGLKTHIVRELAKYQNIVEVSGAFAWEIQEAITDVLVAKTLKAVEKYKVPTLLLAGGVAANTRLREKFRLEIENCKLEIDFRVPPPWLCTDNASYIAACAEYNYKPVPWKKVSANPSLTIMDKQSA